MEPFRRCERQLGAGQGQLAHRADHVAAPGHHRPILVDTPLAAPPLGKIYHTYHLAIIAGLGILIALLWGHTLDVTFLNLWSQVIASHRAKKNLVPIWYEVSILMPGNDLLSHGETPHYHWRSSVSLLSSEWDQVGPERYGCQAIRL